MFRDFMLFVRVALLREKFSVSLFSFFFFAVPFLKEPVVFNPDPRWSGSDALTHKHWEKEHLNGFTHSFVLDNPRDYGLEEGIPSRKGFERFGISMYHQLHCLVCFSSIP